ncbi:dynein-related subfamily AAA family protein [Arcicella aurantiaca]|uniref:Dynein-related subfamily AAA family protein n=1 Tax=Arcicella aurantiaca TaxID=591202 RepID=A0A316DQK8_9BACT|nr:AAA family ATPase [Arcicella aurantiaca]PWK19449.1 dynein-related subfamily AAA family protein [Arcicella aurantiaca]
MKSLYKTTNRKEFANTVFKQISNVKDGWNRLKHLISESKDVNKRSIPKYNLTNVIYVSKDKVKADDLVSGDNIRFFIEPFFQNNQFYAHLSTQWRFKDGKNLDIISVRDLVNNEYSDLFKIEITDKTFELFQLIDTIEIQKNNYKEVVINSNNIRCKQKIYFGSPGTGKSTAMQKFANENGLEVIRTTFHPDTDYHSFVGGYKPVMKDDKITYQFVPQAFTKAYVQAYLNPDKNYLLAIEEINRGNCAQIFGDLFQCLDRNPDGYSCYPIDANADLANYLASQGLENPEQLILPANLLIYATMNTSDQSLFPMDAAFKRRWDWQYVPIEFDEKANEIKIVFDNETQYSWRLFIEKVNEKIKEITKSEDKKIGVYFVSVDENNTISLAQFQNKVMFYLWSEIFKDEHESADSIFKYKNSDGNETDFTFNELFESEGLTKLKGFMNYLLKPIQ